MAWWNRRKKRRSQRDLKAVVAKAEREGSQVDDLEFDEVTDLIDIVTDRAAKKNAECKDETDRALEELGSIKLTKTKSAETAG